MASTTTPDEAARRTANALVLANWLHEHHYKADDVAEIKDYGREAVVRLTRCDGFYNTLTGRKLAADYIPSDATWAAAMTVLRERESKPDPFKGFPTLVQ